MQARLLEIFVQLFPWIHATQEGLRFGYQLLYLLDSSAFYMPSLHFLRQTIVRVSGQEVVYSLPDCCACPLHQASRCAHMFHRHVPLTGLWSSPLLCLGKPSTCLLNPPTEHTVFLEHATSLAALCSWRSRNRRSSGGSNKWTRHAGPPHWCGGCSPKAG